MKVLLIGLVACLVVSGCLTTSEPDTLIPEPVPVPAHTPVPEPTPEPNPVDILLKDIMDHDVADKNRYTMEGTSADVHICGNMAAEQAEWVHSEYGYETGLVLLWNKYAGASHAQTWVIIDDERYVFESTCHEYWTEAEHRDVYCERYKICFNTISKGKEHVKIAAEYYRTG